MTFLSERVSKIPPSGIRVFFDLVMSSTGIISLGVGEPDFLTPWNIRDEAIYRIEKGFTSYTSNKGLHELRMAISSYLKLFIAHGANGGGWGWGYLEASLAGVEARP